MCGFLQVYLLVVIPLWRIRFSDLSTLTLSLLRLHKEPDHYNFVGWEAMVSFRTERITSCSPREKLLARTARGSSLIRTAVSVSSSAKITTCESIETTEIDVVVGCLLGSSNISRVQAWLDAEKLEDSMVKLSGRNSQQLNAAHQPQSKFNIA